MTAPTTAEGAQQGHLRCVSAVPLGVAIPARPAPRWEAGRQAGGVVAQLDPPPPYRRALRLRLPRERRGGVVPVRVDGRGRSLGEPELIRTPIGVAVPRGCGRGGDGENGTIVVQGGMGLRAERGLERVLVVARGCG